MTYCGGWNDCLETEMDSPTLTVLTERLGASEFFADLSWENRAAMAEFCSEASFLEHDVLLSEGKPADKMFVIQRGKVALEKKIQVGRQSTPRNATIDYVGPGGIAGFSTLASPHVYSTTGICVEPTRAIVMDGVKLRAYLEAHPEAGRAIMTELATLVSNRYRTAINTLTYFLSIVSHELRSPLAAIENYLQTMLGGFTGELNEKQERMMRRSVLRVTDLRVLIGDVVDLARMRPEQIQADFEWFDPGQIGAESIEDVHLAAMEKGVRIRVDPPPEFRPIVGARRRMRQVFTNLLNNAIKFSPPESNVRFRAHYEPDALVFVVEDQGPGIPEEEAAHIFKDFYRASNIGDTQGMGLGLSIAQKIVEAHGGTLCFENIFGEKGDQEVAKPIGSRFTVRIPLDLKTPEMRRREWTGMGGEDAGDQEVARGFGGDDTGGREVARG